MMVETIQDRTSILIGVQDASCRAIRWDALPHAVVFDLDCPVETKTDGLDKVTRLHRAWMIVDGARELAINLEWGEFRDGFSILEVKAWDREDVEGLTRYNINADFPHGTISLSGIGLVLLRSSESANAKGMELPTSVREGLAHDADLRKTFAALRLR